MNEKIILNLIYTFLPFFLAIKQVVIFAINHYIFNIRNNICNNYYVFNIRIVDLFIFFDNIHVYIDIRILTIYSEECMKIILC